MKTLSTLKALALSCLSVACATGTSLAQSSVYSEETIKFDILTQKPDKPIPFDRSFTLEVSKVPIKDIVRVDLFESKIQDGIRGLKKNNFRCGNIIQNVAVRDATLTFDKSGESLLIFFPPLKPNKLFDINIVTKLSADSRAILKLVDTLLVRGANPLATRKYGEFFLSTIDKSFNRTYTKWRSITDYTPFFITRLQPVYTQLRLWRYYQRSNLVLTRTEIQAISVASDSIGAKFKDANYLLALLSHPNLPSWSMGLVDIRNVYSRSLRIDSLDFAKRQAALSSNVNLLDSLLQRIDRIIAHGIETVQINRTVITLPGIRGRVAIALYQTRANSELITSAIKKIDSRVDSVTQIARGIFLAGTTAASDLKTQGGNILFADVGISNMIVPGVTSSTVSIPKLYYGVSIYFRPIDKNTRRNRFPTTFTPSRNYGCSISSIDTTYGPDYSVVTRKSILQQLSLNVGLTVGSMTNKDFDNFLNNNSLLVGPAFRFKRAFKVSAGMSLIRRSSRDPLTSEKVVVMGSYISLSVDVDFIQSIKDITSMVLK